MSAGQPAFVVVNPSSGGGRGRALLEPVLGALRQAGVAAEHALSTHAGEEVRLAEQALRRGFRTVVAVGGDGTWSNVAGVLIAAGGEAALGLVPGGTGCDLAKSLGVPAEPRACARIVAAGHTRAVDAGRIEGRHFLNVAGFGFDIAVIEDAWSLPPWVPRALVYPWCALRQIGRFRGFEVEVGGLGPARRRQRLLMLVLANGRVFGGGFHIAPSARLDDGALDLVAVHDMGTPGRLAVMAALLRGRHQGRAGVECERVSSLALRFDAPPAYETDGEWVRARSAELEVGVRRAALRVFAPAPGS